MGCEYCESYARGSTAWVTCLASCQPGGAAIPDEGTPIFRSEVTAPCPTPWLLVLMAAGLGYLLARA